MPIDTAQNTIQNPYTPIADRWRNATRDWKRDAAKQATIAGAEFDADLALLDYQNLYNDPTAKAERMRAAGLNPDLVGLDGAGDSAGMSGVTGSSGISAGPNYLDRVNSLLANSQNVVSSAFDIYEQLQGIRSRALENDIRGINLDNLIRNRAIDFVSDAPDFTDYPDKTEYAYSEFDGPQLSKRSKMRYNSLKSSILNSQKGLTLRNKTMSDFAKSRYDLATIQGNNFYSADYDDMLGAIKTWNSFLNQVEKRSQLAKYAKDKYFKDYYQNSNGTLDATRDSNIKKFEYEQKKFDKFLVDQKKSLYGQLGKYGLFGQIMLMSIENGQFGQMVQGVGSGISDLVGNLLFKKFNLGRYFNPKQI